MSDREITFREKYSFTETEYYTSKKILSDLYEEIATAGFSGQTKNQLFVQLGALISLSERNCINLDNFWSFIARTEIAFRVYAHNIIPVKLKELIMLIWKIQCRTENKSPDSPPPINI